MAVLLVLASMAAAWWWAWRTTSKIARQRDWGRLGRLVACTCIAFTALFAAFCISGGLFLPDPTNAAPVLITAGLLILAPLAIGLWRVSISAIPLLQSGNGATTPEKEVMASLADEVQEPVLGSLTVPSLPRELLFSYTDHQGNTSRRRVRVMGIASNDGRQYLDGYCLDRNAMRTFRVDRIQGDLTDAETGELLNVYHLLAATGQRRHMDYTSAKAKFSWDEADEVFDDEEQPTTVLFTGFTKARKAELEAAAEAAGWVVRSTVSRSLDYLVCGPKAGYSKLETAKNCSVCILNKEQFILLLDGLLNDR